MCSKVSKPPNLKLAIIYMYIYRLRYVDSQGIQRVCGGADLKGSQYYPTLLGRAVAELYAAHQSELQGLVANRAQLVRS